MSRVVRVPSGSILDMDRVVMGLETSDAIGRIGLVMAGSPDLVPNITKDDVEALVRTGFIIQIHSS